MSYTEHPYYAIKVEQIPIGRKITQFEIEQGGELYPGISADVDSPEEWQRLLAQAECDFVLSVEDNGQHGDGIWVSLECSRTDSEFEVVFELPDNSLGILIESLLAIQNLRRAQARETP